jgi:predicted O-methyltransferase YrrM
MIADEYNLRCMMASDIVDHLPRLHAEASRPGVVVIELGVRSGNSTAAFLAAAELFDGHVYSVDIARPHVPWFGHPRWSLFIGDDLDVADELPECDVLFVDTSHQYQQTRDELAIYGAKVRTGGVILMHDTELQYPDAHPDGDPEYPVRTAVDDYCDATGLTAEYASGCYGLGIIRIPEENDG